jgi:hypothetical protein
MFSAYCADACVIVSGAPPYVYLLKMHGDKIAGMKYDEVTGDLFYGGEEPLSIYIKESSSKKRIAVFEGGTLCRPEWEGSKESCVESSKGFNLPRYFRVDHSHNYLLPGHWPVKGVFQKRIYLQAGNSSHKKYILQERRVRNTAAIQERLHASQYSLCDDSVE